MAHDTSRQVGSIPRRGFLGAVGGASALALAGCTRTTDGGGGGDGSGNGGANGGLSGEINIAGSSTVFPLATKMSEVFREQHPDVTINLQSTGSGGGFQNHFCPGNTDFNNASRPIKQEEEDLCAENGIEPVELQVATDALTVIVNNEADWIDCITVQDLKAIWSGENPPEKWSDVNSDWPDEQFALFGPTEASGTFDYFLEAIIGEEGTHRQDHQATEQDRTIIQGVKDSQYAMGYLGFAYYSENTDTVKALGIDNGNGCVEPTLETAKAGDYKPLARPLFTYPAKSSLAEEHIAEFARFWIENSTSREIVADDVGYVPLDDNQQSEQMDTLEAAIEEAQG